MNVTLFRDMKAEGWFSMDRYAGALIREFSILPDASVPALRYGMPTEASGIGIPTLRRDNFQFSIFETEPPVRSAKVRDFWRDYVYPNLGRFFQGRVNHVLDHSYAHLLNYLDPAKTVVTCHDLTPLEYESDVFSLERFKRAVANLGIARFVLADSLSTKKDLVEKLSVPEEKIEVIYLGVDPIFRRFDTQEEVKKYRSRLKIPEGKIIINPGSNLVSKNVEGVLRVFKEILVKDTSVYLLRIRPLTREQERLARDLGINDHYLELPNPTDEELVALYNLASVLLQPSFKEGFGLHVLEAMACGLPVIISKGTSLEEIAGSYGHATDPRDPQAVSESLLAVINHQTFTDTSGMVARARKFSWQETARQTFGVYQKVVA